MLSARALAVVAVLVTAFSPGRSAARPPVETTQGDLSPVGDVGPTPTDLEQLLDVRLDDAAARRAFEEALQLMIEQYRGAEVSEADLYLGALAGMVEVLNRKAAPGGAPGGSHTNALMTPPEAAYIEQLTHGRKTGIGIEFQLGSAEGALFINKVYEDSPAARSGIRPSDRVIAIDGHGLVGRDLKGVLGLLRGPAGTPITLTLVRGSSPATRFDVMLTREVYEAPTVEGGLVEGGVGWIRIGQLHGHTAEETRVLLADLQAQGIGALVLDIRYSQGGLITAIQEVASLFLPDGTVVGRLQDARGIERDVTATGPRAFAGPMVCLVNRYTTSGAEMLAAALQENGRATIVGEQTRGKGTTESLFQLTPELSLRLSSAAMLSPLGASWQDTGLSPDYYVTGPSLTLPRGDGTSWHRFDVQLSFALELLRNTAPP